MGQVPFGGDASRPSTCYYAEVAQLVEHDLAKVRVAGSNPVFRSKCRGSTVVVRILGKDEVESSILSPGSETHAPVGQWFKPSHSHCGDRGFESHLEYYMVTIAQLAERRIVVPNVVGSNPTTHPIN